MICFDRITAWILAEHDLFGKPEAHPRIKSEGRLFRIMPYCRFSATNRVSPTPFETSSTAIFLPCAFN